MLYPGVSPFGATSINQSTIVILVDPDGVYSGTTNGPGKSVAFYVYYNGRIATSADVDPGTLYNGSPVAANASLVPPWFSW